MIQLTTALPALTVGPVKPNAAIAADVSGFALALGALLPEIAAPSAGPQGKPGDAATLLPEGQDIAETGKELPDAVPGLGGKSEEKPGAEADKGDDTDAENTPPPPYAWFAASSPSAAPLEAKAEVAPEVTVEAGGKRARREAPLPEAAAPPENAEAQAREAKAVPSAPATPAASALLVPETEPQPPARRVDAPRQPKAGTAAPAAPATAPAAPATHSAPVEPAAPTMAEAAGPANTDAGDAPAEPGARPTLPEPPRELRKAVAEAPVVRITLDKPAPPQKVSIADVTQVQRQAAAAPVSQPVADQIIAAFELPQTRVSAAHPANDAQPELAAVTAPATGAQTAAAVVATGQGQDAALDTRDRQWTAKMIDKIEALQGGPVRETKLSLMPEGLGKVDVSIRQDDGGVLHVQFSTDTQAARQLIADAQPKLAEIAQERGIRIGSTSVESNATGTNGGAGSSANPQMNQGQRHDSQPQRNQPSAPPGARREAEASTDSDERVA